MSQDPKRKRTAAETLLVIEESDAADEAERILALSDEALDRELSEAGFDPKAVRERGRTLAERLTRTSGAPAPSVVGNAWSTAVPPTPRKRIGPRWVALLAAALGVAAVGATVAVPALLARHDEHQFQVDAETSLSPLLLARQIRARAIQACADHQWQECADGLTAARKIDPEGDADERVQEAWESAMRALRPVRTPIPDTK